MGDRTKIADALMCPLGGTLPPDSVPRGHYWDGGFYHCPCGAIVEWVSDDRVAEHQDARVAAALPVLDAAGYDVVLRADPDTEPDGEMPEAFSVVLDELIAVEPDDGFSREDVARAIVGMLQVAGLLTAEVLTDHNTSDDLAAEARRLLDAATPGPWTHPSPTANWFTTPQPIQIDEADWGQETQEGGAMCGYRIGTLADERAWRYADVELIAAAPRLIAALLERAVTAEADLRALSTRTTGDSKVDLRMLYAYEAGIMERDAERAARERAEAEARQLREAIRAHENLHRPDGPDGADGPIEMDGWPCCNDDRLLWAAAVAEVA